MPKAEDSGKLQKWAERYLGKVQREPEKPVISDSPTHYGTQIKNEDERSLHELAKSNRELAEANRVLVFLLREKVSGPIQPDSLNVLRANLEALQVLIGEFFLRPAERQEFEEQMRTMTLSILDREEGGQSVEKKEAGRTKKVGKVGIVRQ
jgi:hypothetical protein